MTESAEGDTIINFIICAPSLFCQNYKHFHVAHFVRFEFIRLDWT